VLWHAICDSKFSHLKQGKRGSTGAEILTIILLMWRIWLAPNNAGRWQMGFNLEFKGLNK